MERPYRHILVDRQGPVSCVRLVTLQFDDMELEELTSEIGRLVDEEGCRKLVLNLGPGEPQFLFSVFLAKLINLQKRLEADGGRLALCQLSDATRGIFQAAALERFFHFYPDQATACEALKSSLPPST